MILIDTHCHLDVPPLGNDVPGALARAAERGVQRLVVPAYDLPSWRLILSLAANNPERVHPALGLHPWAAHQVGEDLPQRLAATIAAAETPVVAVGEIGLDTKIDRAEGYADLETQLDVFNSQLEVAVDLDLPVILHCRGAFEELFTAVGRFDGRLRGVLHAFSRGPVLGRRAIAAGLFLGLGGAITRPRARVRRSAEVLPLDKLVLETDAPSIGLDGILPDQTEPQHVRDVATALADLRGEPLDTIAEVTTANARRLFALPE